MMEDSRLAEIQRHLGTIDTEVELEAFRYGLTRNGETNGVTAHYVETRRREIQNRKGVRK